MDDIEFKSLLITSDGTLCVAGGWCLEQFGMGKSSDIDLFVIKDDNVSTIINSMQDIEGTVSKSSITIVRENKTDLQFIRTKYNSIAEVAYSFDIDACGIVYDGKDFYFSVPAYYAYMTKTSHFNVMNYSPSTSRRLTKYRKRGYDIVMPKGMLDMSKSYSLETITLKYIDEFFYRTGLGATIFKDHSLIKKIRSKIAISFDYKDDYSKQRLKEIERLLNCDEEEFYLEVLKMLNPSNFENIMLLTLGYEVDFYSTYGYGDDKTDFSKQRFYGKSILDAHTKKNYIDKNIGERITLSNKSKIDSIETFLDYVKQ